MSDDGDILYFGSRFTANVFAVDMSHVPAPPAAGNCFCENIKCVVDPTATLPCAEYSLQSPCAAGEGADGGGAALLLLYSYCTLTDGGGAAALHRQERGCGC
jgi:hypothetical protein